MLVGGTVVRGMLGLRPPPAGVVIAAFGEKLESQRARDRRRLDEAHGDAIAEPVRLAAPVADQSMPILVIAEIIRADGARRDEAVRAGVVELDEQPGARRAGNVTFERG